MRILTPNGPGGVAVVAFVLGEREALLACLRTTTGAPWRAAPGDVLSAPRHCRLHLGGVDVDDVLLLDLGAVGCELHLHGSPSVLALLAARFGPPETELPSPAERLLRAAMTVGQLQLAQEQQGLDFAAAVAALRALPPDLRQREVAAALQRSRTALALAIPHRVVFAGLQNVGKSTLLNTLACRERALTGPVPGLTRDPVREVVGVGGYPCELIDTAGEGDAVATVDVEAIAAGRAERQGATMVLVVDGACGPQPVDFALAKQASLVLRSKVDLPQAPWPPAMRCDLSVTCASPAGGAQARHAFGTLLRLYRGLPPAGPVGGLAALDAAQFTELAAAAI